MTTILITTYYHYGIDKSTKEFEFYEDAYKWIKAEYPDAKEIDENTFKDYDSDSTIEIL